MHRILVPADGEAKTGIPKGACILEVRGNRAIVFHERGATFAALCQAASRGQGRLMTLDFETAYAGHYNDYEGEIRADPRGGLQRLEHWCGKRFYRNDLEAPDNRQSRRHQAKRLLMQGRTAEAYRLDRRMGL